MSMHVGDNLGSVKKTGENERVKESHPINSDIDLRGMTEATPAEARALGGHLGRLEDSTVDSNLNSSTTQKECSLLPTSIETVVNRLMGEGPIKNIAKLKESCSTIANRIRGTKLSLEQLDQLNNSIANLIIAMGPVKDTESVAKLCAVLAEKIKTVPINIDTNLSPLENSTERLINSMGPIKHAPSQIALTTALGVCTSAKHKLVEQAKTVSAAINTLSALADSKLVENTKTEGLFRKEGDAGVAKGIKATLETGKNITIDQLKKLGVINDELLRATAKACTSTLGNCNAFPTLSEKIITLAKEKSIPEKLADIYENIDKKELEAFQEATDQILALYKQTVINTSGFTLNGLGVSVQGLISKAKMDELPVDASLGVIMKNIPVILERLFLARQNELN